MIEIHNLEEYIKTKKKCISIFFFEKFTIKNTVEKISLYTDKNKIITTNKLKYININENIVDLSNSIKNISNIVNYKNEISRKIIKIKITNIIYFNKIINNNINTLGILYCKNIKDINGLGTVNTLTIFNCNNITNVSKSGTVNTLRLFDCNNTTDVSGLGTKYINDT